nr:beta-ketoacyl synthase N-terminal-like domain-containing protein [Micromonospora sp. DSM 115978]
MTWGVMASSCVAVVGMSCRLPHAADPRAFWRLLSEGAAAITPMPPGRRRPGAATGPPLGGFLATIDAFDAGFFGVAPREAAVMDPQQRLMLELGWEALEDAGIRPDAIQGSRTGVFVGAIWDEYAMLLNRRGTPAGNRYAMTGVHRSIIANRVSYTLDLRGPSLTVDTAQSSSLVAVYLAIESLRRGECEAALAGGVNLILGEDSMDAAAAQFGGLSPDGRCHTFDAGANGFVRGEGGGAVLLKPLAAALRDGDRVYCVIRGGAVNNDGATSGLTNPARHAQQDVLRRAYQEAGVAPADVQYVELHGTGTRVGDPVEAAALGAALGASRAPGEPLRVGSVKTNVGHLEGAAGITGLLKVVLSLTHRRLPPSLNFTTPSPGIPLAELGLRVQDEPTGWPSPNQPLTAGVSSFGMGGTNCHLVLAEAPVVTAVPGPATPPPILLWPVSGKTPAALRAQAGRLLAHLADEPTADPADVGWALATTRSAFTHRAVVRGPDRETLLAGLDAVRRDADQTGVTRGSSAPGGTVGGLFSGQGSQRPGMGRELYAAYPLFAAAFDDACAAVDPHLDRPLGAMVLGADGALLDQTAYTQPALFAVEVALYRLAESWGLEPGHLMGHSVGEITAVHVAGALSLSDASALVAARGRLMQSVTAPGAMAAWQATEQEATGFLAELSGRVSIAAVNGPTSVVVSGDRDAVHEATSAWRESGHRTTVLRTSHAFHSPHLDAVLDDLRSVAAGLSFAEPRIPVISNVTGRPVSLERLASPDYWAEHARRAVRFMAGVRWMRDEGVTTFVEFGPDAVLAAMTRESLADSPAATRPITLATLRRDRPEVETFAAAMAEAYVRGADLTWRHAFGTGQRPRLPIPTYAFQRQRHWHDTTAEPDRDPPAPQPETAPLAERLSHLPEADRRQALTETVRRQTAIVLGLGGADAVDPHLTFKTLGLDSMAVTELSQRLATETGLPLSTTLAYDHPTPTAAAAHLAAQLTGALPVRSTPPRAGSGGADEPIAVVAMACRYPGGATSPEALWKLVDEGVDAVGEFPGDRGWDLAGMFSAAPDEAGASHTRAGGFLYDAAEFDAALFGISPREATAMDPQQRLLLETAWEAFERASVSTTALRHSATGVFVGATAQEYGPRLHEAPSGLDGHLLTGTTPSVAAGRVAFTFGLEGPAVTVDTACSSSLVAIHLACQSLRLGECDLALAGGATVMATPGMFTEFSRQGGLAPDGRCKSFAASADGTGWGEGVGVVLLERLSDARRGGRRVLAVVRGSAVNQDGASNGLTAPSGRAQERVIGAALAAGGLVGSDVDVVEGHGTGTRLGDPIEVGALLGVFGGSRVGGVPLWLGSVKSNIGHAQAAAGVAGVIKMVMALRCGVLPASLHVDEPTPHVDWSSGGVRLLTERVEWPETGRPRRAGVSSFGISGTNAHLVLEAVADEPETSQAPARQPIAPWVLTAYDDRALHAQARALGQHLCAHPGHTPAEVGRSLVTRSVLPQRAVIVGADPVAGLTALAAGQPHPDVVTGRVVGTGAVLVFPGQGSQWIGMGAELLDCAPAFAARIEECERALAPHVDWSLVAVLRGDGTELDRVDVVQPVLWAVMVSLAALWVDHGVRPSAVVGHSQGEIAAACVAGALTIQDGARIVAVRSRLLRGLAGRGAMASLGVTEDVAVELLRGTPDVTVAAVNGPSSTVVSGPAHEVAAVVAACRHRGDNARPIGVDYASHGPQVDAIVDDLTEALADVEPRPSRVPFYSTVTGARIDTTLLDTSYWVTNLRRKVRFAEAIDAVLADGYRVLVEASPHPVLIPGLVETAERAGVQAAMIPTLRRDQGNLTQVTLAMGQAFTAGVDLDWSRWYPLGAPPTTIDLPTYAFQRRRFWLAGSGAVGGMDAAGLRRTRHPVLPAAVELTGGELVLSGRLSSGSGEWFHEHSVAGVALVPSAVLVEWALRAADETGHEAVRELMIQHPLAMPGSGALLIRVGVDSPGPDHESQVRIHSRAEEHTEWTCHAVGTLGPHPGEGLAEERWPPPDARPMELAYPYQNAAAAGVTYGPAFQGLRALWRHGTDLLAEIALPQQVAEPTAYGIHPVLLDAALHAALLADHPPPPQGQARVPFLWSGVSLWSSGATSARVRLSPVGSDEWRVVLTDALGAPVLTAESVILTTTPVDELHRAGAWAATGAGTSRPARGAARRRRAASDDRAGSVDLAARLKTLPADERTRAVLDLVRGHAATVLGHTDPAEVHLDARFKDLGLTSVTAVDLRGRLAEATGLRLPTALVFRYPTPQDVADELLRLLSPADGPLPDGRDTAAPLLYDLARLESTLADTELEDGERGVVTARLEELLARWRRTDREPDGEADAAARLRSASTEQVLDFIESELGVS